MNVRLFIALVASSFILSQGMFAAPGVSPGDSTSTLSKEGYIAVNGTRLFFTTLGKGDPLVIIHGGPGLDHTYLLPQMAALAARNTLIFFDQRASGKSALGVDSNSMSMATFVEDIEGIRKAFGLKKMNLFAHSWGGLLAMYYAIKYPDRLNSLILSNSSPASSSFRRASFKIMQQRTSRDDSLAGAALIGTEGFKERDAMVMERSFRILFRSGFADPRYADSLTLTLPDDYAARNKSLQYLFKDTLATNYDITDRLKVIQCPVLILGGTDDFIPPEATAQLAAAIPGARLITLKRSGHFPFVDQQHDFVEAVQTFLEGVPRTGNAR